MPSSPCRMGPFHVLKVSLVPRPVHRFLAKAGVTPYWSVSQATPAHGDSHVHTPLWHTPLSEQLKAVWQGAGGDIIASGTRVAVGSRSMRDLIAVTHLRSLAIFNWPPAYFFHS